MATLEELDQAEWYEFSGNKTPEQRQAKMAEMLARMKDPEHQKEVAASDAVIERLAEANADVDEWEKSDDQGRPSEKILRKTQTKQAKTEKANAKLARNILRGDFLNGAEPTSKLPDQPGAGVAGGDVRTWSLIKDLERLPGYRWPLYCFCQRAHDSGKSRPKPLEVLFEWREKLPPEIVRVNADTIDYYDADGNEQTASLEAIRKAIGRMTGR
jgi:hypothetical protein